MSAPPVIEVQDLHRIYQVGTETVAAVQGIDLVVEMGEAAEGSSLDELLG